MEQDDIKNKILKTGYFFEDVCVDKLEEIKKQYPQNIELYTQMPFSLNDNVSGCIDCVFYSLLVENKSIGLCLVCEFKRVVNNKNWIFFKKRKEEIRGLLNFQFETNDCEFVLNENDFSGMIVYDRAKEIDISGSEKNDNKDPIYEAGKQVNNSLRALLNTLHYKRYKNTKFNNHRVSLFFVPVIVTTTKLYECSFESKNVSISNGGIEKENIELVEKDWVEYIFPLLEYQKHAYDFSSTFIVNSEKINEFYSHIQNVVSKCNSMVTERKF
jgi:hypothetical protein